MPFTKAELERQKMIEELAFACKFLNTNKIKEILNKCNNKIINDVNIVKNTPLHICFDLFDEWKSLKIKLDKNFNLAIFNTKNIGYLIKNGANTNIVNKKNQTILDRIHDNEDIQNLIIDEYEQEFYTHVKKEAKLFEFLKNQKLYKNWKNEQNSSLEDLENLIFQEIIKDEKTSFINNLKLLGLKIDNKVIVKQVRNIQNQVEKEYQELQKELEKMFTKINIINQEQFEENNSSGEYYESYQSLFNENQEIEFENQLIQQTKESEKELKVENNFCLIS